MPRILDHSGHLRTNLVAYIALFVALSGTSYAALSLPAGKRWQSTAQEPGSHRGEAEPDERRGSVRAWATLQWFGAWRVQSSSSDIHVANIAAGEVVSWRHTRFRATAWPP